MAKVYAKAEWNPLMNDAQYNLQHQKHLYLTKKYNIHLLTPKPFNIIT